MTAVITRPHVRDRAEIKRIPGITSLSGTFARIVQKYGWSGYHFNEEQQVLATRINPAFSRRLDEKREDMITDLIRKRDTCQRIFNSALQGLFLVGVHLPGTRD